VTQAAISIEQHRQHEPCQPQDRVRHRRAPPDCPRQRASTRSQTTPRSFRPDAGRSRLAPRLGRTRLPTVRLATACPVATTPTKARRSLCPRATGGPRPVPPCRRLFCQALRAHRLRRTSSSICLLRKCPDELTRNALGQYFWLRTKPAHYLLTERALVKAEPPHPGPHHLQLLLRRALVGWNRSRRWTLLRFQRWSRLLRPHIGRGGPVASSPPHVPQRARPTASCRRPEALRRLGVRSRAISANIKREHLAVFASLPTGDGGRGIPIMLTRRRARMSA
jgi:hypothetical protein